MVKIERDSIPPELISAVRDEDITFLVGAGASQDSPANVPAWQKLAELLDTEIGEKQDSRFDRNKEPSSYIWDQVKKNPELRKWIINEIAKNAERIENEQMVPSDLHRMIMRMARKWCDKPELVITTNYDRLLEAAADQGTDWVAPIEQWHGPASGQAEAARGIYHLHGTLKDRKKILLTDTEMQDHYAANENMHSKHLTKIFEDRVIFAIGYGFSDPEIRKILREIREDSFGRMFAIIEEKPNGEGPELPDRVNAITYRNGQHDEVKKILNRIEKMAATGSKRWQ